METIEEELGKIIITNPIATEVLERIRTMRTLSSQQLMVWKTRVREDNEAYLNILRESSCDIPTTIAEIKNETKTVLEVLRKLNQGVSWSDVNLITNARWIRLNTKFEPVVISDDRDLLTCGQILSSFFGLILGFLSSFEILRLVELDEPFIKYCNYYTLSEDLGSINNTWSKEALKTEISNVMREAKIACHPSLRGTSAARACALLRTITR